MKPTIQQIQQVLDNGIWYYDKLGKVNNWGRWQILVNNEHIVYCSYKRSFDWEDLGVKFWLTKEEAELKAKEYLDEVLKYVNITTLKKICKIKIDKDFTFWVKEDNTIYESSLNTYDCHYYDKKKKAIVYYIEYDDDFGGTTEMCELPISEYGKTWALTEKELKKGYTK